jgi:HEAT repeat protein
MFLIGVIADPAGYDLARIEAMKILRLSPPPDAGARQAAGRAIAAVLGEDDELLRQFAAMSLGPYLSDDVAFAAVEHAALHDEDLDVRHNALAALAESGPSPRNAELLGRLADDPDLGHAAGRVKRDWSHRVAG